MPTHAYTHTVVKFPENFGPIYLRKIKKNHDVFKLARHGILSQQVNDLKENSLYVVMHECVMYLLLNSRIFIML